MPASAGLQVGDEVTEHAPPGAQAHNYFAMLEQTPHDILTGILFRYEQPQLAGRIAALMGVKLAVTLFQSMSVSLPAAPNEGLPSEIAAPSCTADLSGLNAPAQQVDAGLGQCSCESCCWAEQQAATAVMPIHDQHVRTAAAKADDVTPSYAEQPSAAVHHAAALEVLQAMTDTAPVHASMSAFASLLKHNAGLQQGSAPLLPAEQQVHFSMPSEPRQSNVELKHTPAPGQQASIPEESPLAAHQDAALLSQQQGMAVTGFSNLLPGKQQYVGDWLQGLATHDAVVESVPEQERKGMEDERALAAFALQQAHRSPVLERWLQLQLNSNPALAHLCMPGEL